MKKSIIFVAVISSLVVGFTAKDGLTTLGLKFAAPTINGRGNVSQPEVGEIVYDSSDAIFYGRSQTAGWVPLGGAPSIIPPGTILPYGGTIAPAGFVLCAGQTLAVADYPDLYAVIGTSFGSTTLGVDFRVPDFRGRFLRGVDNGAGNDPDRATRKRMAPNGNDGDQIGSVQGHAFQTHRHTSELYSDSSTAGTSALGARTSILYNAAWPTSYASATGTTAEPSSSETRPVNANVNYIIKL